MPHTITAECISCGACVEQCPVDAITQDETQFTIDKELCIDCDACTAVCPVNAIVVE
ncbi:MAG: 4Fe-4S binding protein [Candidatus Hydrogenedentota bacterium]